MRRLRVPQVNASDIVVLVAVWVASAHGAQNRTATGAMRNAPATDYQSRIEVVSTAFSCPSRRTNVLPGFGRLQHLVAPNLVQPAEDVSALTRQIFGATILCDSPKCLSSSRCTSTLRSWACGPDTDLDLDTVPLQARSKAGPREMLYMRYYTCVPLDASVLSCR